MALGTVLVQAVAPLTQVILYPASGLSEAGNVVSWKLLHLRNLGILQEQD